MRDKVLCVGWARSEKPMIKGESILLRKSYFCFLQSFFPFLLPYSVPVSVQGGVKMSIDEVLSLFDHNAAWRDQRAQGGFFEKISKHELDTIFVTESLFRGTVVDFDGLGLRSGGGNFAKSDTEIN